MCIGWDDAKHNVFQALEIIDVVANVGGVVGQNAVCFHPFNEFWQLVVTTLDDLEVQFLGTRAYNAVLFFGQNQHFDTGILQQASTHPVASVAHDELFSRGGDDDAVICKNTIEVKHHCLNISQD